MRTLLWSGHGWRGWAENSRYTIPVGECQKEDQNQGTAKTPGDQDCVRTTRAFLLQELVDVQEMKGCSACLFLSPYRPQRRLRLV